MTLRINNNGIRSDDETLRFKNPKNMQNKMKMLKSKKIEKIM